MQLLVLWLMTLLVTACDRRVNIDRPGTPAGSQTPASTGAAPEKIDPADLINGDEIRAVLGEELKQPITSSRDESGFVIAQCYFLVPTASNSAVLTVTSHGAGADSRSPRQFWMEKFHAAGPTEKDSDGEQEERKQAPPETIADLGDEAYWVESGSTGALYVLQADRFVRLAIGGTDEKPVRIDKARKLAQFALKRLPLR